MAQTLQHIRTDLLNEYFEEYWKEDPELMSLFSNSWEELTAQNLLNFLDNMDQDSWEARAYEAGVLHGIDLAISALAV